MDTLQFAPVSMCLSKAGLSAGTTTTISTAAAITFANRGKMYSKSAITNGVLPTLDATSGAAFPTISANQGSIVYIGLDNSGNINAMQGSVVALDVSGNFINAPLVPAIPGNVTPFGYIVLKGGATLSGTWQFGTNNLSAVTGMGYVFQDLASMPDRPQIS